MRGLIFGAMGLLVFAAVLWGSFWLAWQLSKYAELGDYLLRLGLSWLFLTFLSFLAFSGVVTALSTFFLSDDLKLLMATPIAARRLFHARFARTIGQASWMVVAFLVPVLAGVGLARCVGPQFYVTADPDGGALRRHSRRGRDGGDAGARQRLSRPARARHPHADGPAVCGGARRAAAHDSTGAAAARRVAARHHGILRRPAGAGHGSAAVVLGGRSAVHEPAGRSRLAARRRALDDGARPDRPPRRGVRALALCRVQQGAGGAQGALHAAALARAPGASAPALDGAPPSADQGREGLPAGRQPVVAAPAASGAGARLSLQLPRARSRARAVHERHRQERLCAHQPRHGRLRHGDDRGAVRVPCGVGRGRRILDHPHRADCSRATFSGPSSGPASCPCSC